jgi:hypothetical protein
MTPDHFVEDQSVQGEEYNASALQVEAAIVPILRLVFGQRRNPGYYRGISGRWKLFFMLNMMDETWP